VLAELGVEVPHKGKENVGICEEDFTLSRKCTNWLYDLIRTATVYTLIDVHDGSLIMFLSREKIIFQLRTFECPLEV